jgi:hypothetical protein
MMMIKVFFQYCLVALLIASANISWAQKKQGTTFGFQLKPIIPVNYFNAGPQTISDSTVEINIAPKTGMSFGVLIRQQITKSIAIESGISSVRRNYDISSTGLTYDTTDQSDFGFISYQIPIQGLVYIQLSEKIFMNTTAGIGLDMYPSSVETKGENYLLYNISYRQHWLSYSLLANLGFEYRTEKKGTFYLGASFNSPFRPIAESFFYYNYEGNKQSKLKTFLNGNYLTLDLRFFFPENTSSKKKKSN